jgi:prepilin-type N-terminal cleavage/methylation domain-containing protein/prepilin-type processing-associated H-X9-DG protein
MKAARRSRDERHGRTGGFALVELLVVIAVVGVLAGLLLPALAKAKGKARSIACQSQLGQWAKALAGYETEDDELPLEKAPAQAGKRWAPEMMNTWAVVGASTNSEVWYNGLAEEANGGRGMSYYAVTQERRDEFYAPNLFLCPSSRPDPVAAILRPQFSLAMNSKLVKAGQRPRKNCTFYPSRTALFLDAGVPGELELPGQPYYDGRPHVYANRFSARHHGRGNIVFFDSHVEALPARQVVTLDGQAFFPVEQIQWSSDPEQDPNG